MCSRGDIIKIDLNLMGGHGLDLCGSDRRGGLF